MKLTKEDESLIKEAKDIIIKSKPVDLIDTGDVGSALITSNGNLFRGVSLGFYCGIGSCGEYQAIGSMISNGEKEIKTIVAVFYDSKKDGYEVQMLMGVPKQTFQDELIQNGILIRLYVPFAEKWKYASAYCKRRMTANPAMAAYIVKNILHKAAGKS